MDCVPSWIQGAGHGIPPISRHEEAAYIFFFKRTSVCARVRFQLYSFVISLLFTYKKREKKLNRKTVGEAFSFSRKVA